MTVKLTCQTSLRIGLIVALTVGLLARPAKAQDDDSQGRQAAQAQAYHFEIRGDYLWEHFANAQGLLDGNTFTALNFNGKPGGGVDFEYRFVPTFGVDFAVSQTGITGKEVTTSSSSHVTESKANIQVRPITVGLVEHPFQWKRVDFYIGILAGVVDMSGNSFRTAESRFGFGSVVGVDIPVGQGGWAINAVGRLVSSRFSNQFNGTSHFRDEFFYGGGLTYRW